MSAETLAGDTGSSNENNGGKSRRRKESAVVSPSQRCLGSVSSCTMFALITAALEVPENR